MPSKPVKTPDERITLRGAEYIRYVELTEQANYVACEKRRLEKFFEQLDKSQHSCWAQGEGEG